MRVGGHQHLNSDSRMSIVRNINVLEFMTLDGVIQAGGGPDEDTSGGFRYGGWQAPYSDDVLGNVMAEQMTPPFALLLGRRTFDILPRTGLSMRSIGPASTRRRSMSYQRRFSGTIGATQSSSTAT